MDVVEEFLELGRDVSVPTTVKMLGVLEKSFPRRLLPTPVSNTDLYCEPCVGG